MSLADLINERDAKLAEQKKLVTELADNVAFFLNDIKHWEQRNRWRVEDGNKMPQISYLFFGMRFWPRLITEAHEQYVKGMNNFYLLTLSLEQANVLKDSVFGGMATGAVVSNWTYEWRTDYRQDGWVELIVGSH